MKESEVCKENDGRWYANDPHLQNPGLRMHFEPNADYEVFYNIQQESRKCRCCPWKCIARSLKLEIKGVCFRCCISRPFR